LRLWCFILGYNREALSGSLLRNFLFLMEAISDEVRML
jgi:hypothetical protein